MPEDGKREVYGLRDGPDYVFDVWLGIRRNNPFSFCIRFRRLMQILSLKPAKKVSREQNGGVLSCDYPSG
jgi:hypothetical protein